MSDEDKKTLHISDAHRDVAGVDVVLLALEHHSGGIVWKESATAACEGHYRAVDASQAQPIKFHEVLQRWAPDQG